MLTEQQQREAWMRDEANAVAAWLKADLHRRYAQPEDMPAELLQLIEKACTRA